MEDVVEGGILELSEVAKDDQLNVEAEEPKLRVGETVSLFCQGRRWGGGESQCAGNSIGVESCIISAQMTETSTKRMGRVLTLFGL